MAHMRFGGSCCCCRILHDEFTRANSSDLGNNWTEASGAWSILSNYVQESSGGILVCDLPHPLGECSVVARVTWTGGGQTATLTEAQLPSHTHTMRAAADPGELQSPGTSGDRSLARAAIYQSDTSSNLVPLSGQALPAGS